MFLRLKTGSCFIVQVSISLLFSCLSPLNARKAELEWVPWSRIGSWNQNPELEPGFSSHCTTFLVCSVCGERMWATEKQTESLQLGELKRTQAWCTNMLEEKETSRKLWRLQGRWGLWENTTPTHLSSFGCAAVMGLFSELLSLTNEQF